MISKVSLQHCIFSSDGSQDGQIMRSHPLQSQRMHCAWLGNRQWDRVPLPLLPAVRTHPCSLRLLPSIANEHPTWDRNNCMEYIILPNRLHANYDPSLFSHLTSPPTCSYSSQPPRRPPLLPQNQIRLCLQSPELLRM